MRFSFVQFSLLFLFFFLNLSNLSADQGDSRNISYKTIYREDKFYETSGAVSVQGSSMHLNKLLLEVSQYREWVLQGLGRDDVGAEGLPAFLVDIEHEPSRPSDFTIIYDLNKFLKFKGLSADFTTQWDFNEKGVISRLSFIYNGKKSFLKEGSYSFFFEEQAGGIQIDFICEVRLSGFLDMFFNVGIYNNNMDPYIRGLSGNLKKKLETLGRDGFE